MLQILMMSALRFFFFMTSSKISQISFERIVLPFRKAWRACLERLFHGDFGGMKILSVHELLVKIYNSTINYLYD